MEAGRVTLSDGVVCLDPFRADDMAAHLAGEDEEQARRFGWWPRRSGPAQFRGMLEADREAWRTGGPRRRFAVRADGALVGGCEIRRREDGVGDVSYWTFPAHRGRGYATRATRLACAWAFDGLGVAAIEAHVEDDNAASRRVAERAGFVRSGRRDADGLLVYQRLR